ncbi:hypothetical protein PCA20602_02703 [Pandoraea capi]|uniref:Integrase n=1 Tax=Pandoraea capi TaxID=2508286 RepID=A0ABY6W0T7_9BURK|nr:hypothetical protein PCA20602_02703 [Pandoraea capi]
MSASDGRKTFNTHGAGSRGQNPYQKNDPRHWAWDQCWSDAQHAAALRALEESRAAFYA